MEDTSFVYVIAAKENPTHVKIGISKNPDARVRQLQTGHAAALAVYHRLEFPAKNARLIERVIHNTLRMSKLKGEWFDLTVDQAIAEVDFAMIRFGDAAPIELKDYLAEPNRRFF